ncbi:oxidoreductase-like domain-containing protein [Viridibacterium curvum]
MSDSAPTPPREPDPLDCCGNECGDACVWTLYYAARKQYEADLEAWQIAQLSAEP